MANIKQVQTSNGLFDVEALHFKVGSLDTPADWKGYIDSLVGEGLKIVIDEKHASKEEPATAPSASTMGKLYMVTLTDQLSGTYTEFVTVNPSASTYVWEKIGTTEVDLSNYMRKDTLYTGAAMGDGSHTHDITGTVNVPVVSNTGKKLKIASGNAVTGSKSTANAITGFGAHSTKVALGENATFTTGVTPATTNIKATASGAEVGVKSTDAVLGADTTFKVDGGEYSGATQAAFNIGKFNGGTATTPTVIDTSKFSGGSITNGSVTTNVDDEGVLSFTYTAPVLTPAAIQSGFYTAGTQGTPASMAPDIFTPNNIGSVSAVSVSANKNDSVNAATAVEVTVQPSVALATGATAGAGVISVATGITSATTTVSANDAVTAITGLGTPTTAAAITELNTASFVNGVSTAADGTIAYVESISVDTTPANISAEAAADGMHTHDVQAVRA